MALFFHLNDGGDGLKVVETSTYDVQPLAPSELQQSACLGVDGVHDTRHIRQSQPE